MQQKVDFIQQPAMASSMVGLGRSSKEPVQTKLAPKRSHGPCLGGLLLVWSTTVFWILVEPLHLRSMLSKLIDEPKTSMPTGSIGQQKGPNSSCRTMSDCMSHNQCFKSWMIEFCLICHIHLTSCQLTIISSSISTTLCRENASTTAGGRTCFPRVCWILKLRFLHCRNKQQTYFLLAKMCWF